MQQSRAGRWQHPTPCNLLRLSLSLTMLQAEGKLRQGRMALGVLQEGKGLFLLVPKENGTCSTVPHWGQLFWDPLERLSHLSPR